MAFALHRPRKQPQPRAALGHGQACSVWSSLLAQGRSGTAMSSYKAPQGAHVARICSRSGSSSSILPLWTGAAVRTVRHGGVATVLVAWKDRAVRVIAWQLVTCQIVAVTEKRPEATMIQVTEIRWVAGYRFYFRFSDDSVG